MFLIFINSLSEEDLASRISMFADDTRVGKGIKNEDDIETLQRDLDNIFDWQKEHNMTFNRRQILKWSDMETVSDLLHRSQEESTNQMMDLQIKISPFVRDLGIQIAENCRFHHPNKQSM